MRFEKVETIRLSDFRRALGQVAFLSYAAVRIVQGDFSTLLEMTVEPLCGRIQRVPFKGEGGRGLQPRKLLRFSVLTALWAEGYGGGCAADFIGRLTAREALIQSLSAFILEFFMQCKEWDNANSQLFKESHDEAVHKNSYKSRLYE